MSDGRVFFPSAIVTNVLPGYQVDVKANNMATFQNLQSIHPDRKSIEPEALQRYLQGAISLNKLAELLDIPLEQIKVMLREQNIPLNLGISSEAELLSDIENA